MAYSPRRVLPVVLMALAIAGHSACDSDDAESSGMAGTSGKGGSESQGGDGGGAKPGGAAGGADGGSGNGSGSGGDSGGGDSQGGDTGGDAGSGSGDAGSAGLGGEGGGGPAPALHPVTYPGDRTHSPITPYVAARLAEIASADASLADDLFAKVGDNIFESSNFATCFDGAFVDLDGRAELSDTLGHFLAGEVGGMTAFGRNSQATTVGYTTNSLLLGEPTSVELELAAVQPRFAAIMIGLNDVGSVTLPAYGANLLDLTDTIVGAGVVPLFFSSPPRADSVSAQEEVVFYNAMVRAVAQAYQVPFVDYHREMVGLPSLGLAGDGVHPNTYVDGGARPCVLTAAGLQYGYNRLNLLLLEALDRAREALSGDLELDPAGEPLGGSGTSADPIEIPSLPFSDRRDTTTSPSDAIDSYVCGVQDMSGPEYVYHLSVSEPTSVRATVVDRGTTDVDLHLLEGSPSPDDCIARNDSTIETTLEPGDYYFVVDTYVSSGTPHPGEFLFVLTPAP